MTYKTQEIFDTNNDLFTEANIEFKQWEHEPILDYETDERIAKELHWTAAPTKTLFLKIKGGGNCLLFTHKDERLDSKLVKKYLGKRVSVCSQEEMVDIIGCVPGAVCPFGLSSDITLLIDPIVFQYKELMFTPGKPDFTFSFESSELSNLLDQLANPVIILDKKG